jgi:deoxyribonucleoside regulator
MSNYIARQIKAPRPLPGLTVGPMVGVLGVEYDPFEANIIASAIASRFGGHSLLLPSPAVVDREAAGIVEAMPLVRRVMEFYREATVAIVPIAFPDPERSTVVRAGLLTPDEVRDLVARGAVGEIASHWWFDAEGQVVEETATHAIGLGLDGLSEMVRRRAKVVAVVGASRERVSPLRAALDHKLINVLITDHVTAQLLLSRE